MNILPTSVPATFEKTLGETTYQLDGRPVQLVVLGAALSLLLLVALLVVAQRRAGAMVSPFVPLISIPFCGVAAFVYGARYVPWSGKDALSSTVVFHDAIVTDSAAAGIGVGVAVAALLILALRTANQLRLVAYALPCAVLGFACLRGIRHAEAISKVGSMPFYAVSGQRDVHVGRDRDVPVTTMRPPGRRFWSGMESGPQPIDAKRSGWTVVDHVHVHAAHSPGAIPFTAEARKGPVTLSTKLEIRAVPETASPLLSLRVGDRFVYRVRAKSSDGAFLFFFKLSGSSSLSEVTVEVIGTREREAFRTFLLEVTREGSAQVVEVVAISGETRFYDAEHATVGEPIVTLTGDGSQRDPVPCRFALLNAADALCQRGGADRDVAATVPVPYVSTSTPGKSAPLSKRELSRRERRNETNRKSEDVVGRPPVAFEAAAPAAFERNTSSAGRGLMTAFVAILTVGIVILPDGSSHTSYTLVSTHRGPVGAAEAPPG